MNEPDSSAQPWIRDRVSAIFVVVEKECVSLLRACEFLCVCTVREWESTGHVSTHTRLMVPIIRAMQEWLHAKSRYRVVKKKKITETHIPVCQFGYCYPWQSVRHSHTKGKKLN